MKVFKRIDLLVNTGLLAGFLVAAAFQLCSLFTAYYVIGGWQLFSMIVHGWNGWFMQKNGRRRNYQEVVIMIGLLVLLSNWVPAFLVIFFFLLFGAPVMAIIYTLICYEECRQMKERPLSQLK